MNLFLELYHFLLNPKEIINKSVKSSPRILFKETIRFLVFDLICVFAWSLIVATMIISFDSFNNIFSSREPIKGNNMNVVFYVAMLIPLIEELAYRLPLKVNKKNLAISISVQLVILANLAGLIELSIAYRIGLMIVLFIIFWYSLPKTIIDFTKKYFRYLIYVNVLLFALIHIPVYDFSSYIDYLFAPILILIQLVLGIYLSYARIKHGFNFALGIHILHNVLFIGFGTLFGN